MNELIKQGKRVALVVLGALFSSIAINFFVKSEGLLSGGFSGISMLLSRLFSDFLHLQVSFSWFYLAFNAIPTLLVLKYVGKKFTLYSVLHILLVSLFTSILPVIKLSDDRLLGCLFGGMVSACGMLFTLRASACTGGTDFIAIWLSNKYHRAFWNETLIMNAAVLLISGRIYGLESSLYSVVYQATATVALNMFHNRYKLVTLHIFTDKPDEVSAAILQRIRHGITKIDGIGMYSHQPHTLLYIVAWGYQVNLLLSIIRKVDDKAFVNEMKSSRVIGNYYQEPYD
ncbi:MAG: YitT family protein [Erysipelotrichaceae bacterium]|jgi:uncharacterized membrane-anchored protein YitT (DUF2179 family)|nr:YitT family protein [Erysipelotrichaceae bacterium]